MVVVPEHFLAYRLATYSGVSALDLLADDADAAG